jgi:hypothetical protein
MSGESVMSGASGGDGKSWRGEKYVRNIGNRRFLSGFERLEPGRDAVIAGHFGGTGGLVAAGEGGSLDELCPEYR